MTLFLVMTVRAFSTKIHQISTQKTLGHTVSTTHFSPIKHLLNIGTTPIFRGLVWKKPRTVLHLSSLSTSHPRYTLSYLSITINAPETSY